MRSALGLAAAAALALAAAPCAAQDAPVEAPDAQPERSVIARGRSLGWGVTGVVPIYLGDVRARDGTPIAYVNPGGGIEGRVFYELPGGIGLGVVGGVDVNASQSTRPLTHYRGAAEARWAIDVGVPELAPLVSIAIGLMIAQVGADTLVTGFARAFGGAQVIFADWVALEVGLGVECGFGPDAFADPVAWLSPQIGVTFYE